MSGAQLKGWKRGNLHEEAARTQAAAIGREYDSDEWTSGVVTNQSLRGRVGSKLFVNVDVAHRVLIRASKTVTVRFNSASAPVVTINAGEPYEEQWLEVDDIFLTTTDASTPMAVVIS